MLTIKTALLICIAFIKSSWKQIQCLLFQLVWLCHFLCIILKFLFTCVNLSICKSVIRPFSIGHDIYQQLDPLIELLLRNRTVIALYANSFLLQSLLVSYIVRVLFNNLFLSNVAVISCYIYHFLPWICIVILLS